MRRLSNFGRTKQGKLLKKHLTTLMDCQDNAYDELTRIEEQHIDLSAANINEYENYITAFPIESLYDSCRFDAKKPIRNRLGDLKLRTLLRKKWYKKDYQLDKIDLSVYLAEIEFTIASINHLIKKT